MAKVIGTFLLFLFFCGGLNGMLPEEPSPQFLFRSHSRRLRAPLEVVCVTSDYPLPVLDESDQMLNKLCTRVLYRIPLVEKFSDWEYSLKHSDPLADYRQRYPDIRFQVSVPDYFLTTTSSTEMPQLVAYLVKMQAGLDVMVDANTDLGVLYHTLMSYRDILPLGKQLSISITQWDNPAELVDRGITEAVNVIHIFPPYFPNESSVTRDSAIFLDVEKFIQKFIHAGIRSRMLVVGLTSTSAVNSGSFFVPSMAEVCKSMAFYDWNVERVGKDEFVWKNAEIKGWTYRTFVGNSIIDQVNSLFRMRIYGVGLFDLPFERPVNPICLAHKNNVVYSVYRGLAFNASSQDSNVMTDLSLNSEYPIPEFKVIGGLYGGGRLGKVLVFSNPVEEELYVRYFNISDDHSLLSSPIEHIVLGYSDEGKVFDIYHPRCEDDKRDSWFLQYLNYLVNYYSLESVLAEAHAQEFLVPPSILIFPRTTDYVMRDKSDRAYVQIVPILITWFRIRTTYPWQHVKESYATTQGPRSQGDYRESYHSQNLYGGPLSFYPSVVQSGRRCSYRKLNESPRRLPWPISMEGSLETSPISDPFTGSTSTPSGILEQSPLPDTTESILDPELNETTVQPEMESSVEQEERVIENSTETLTETNSDSNDLIDVSTLPPEEPKIHARNQEVAEKEEPKVTQTQLEFVPSTTPVPTHGTTVQTSGGTRSPTTSMFSFESIKSAFEEAFKKMRNSFAALG